MRKRESERERKRGREKDGGREKTSSNESFINHRIDTYAFRKKYL